MNKMSFGHVSVPSTLVRGWHLNFAIYLFSCRCTFRCHCPTSPSSPSEEVTTDNKTPEASAHPFAFHSLLVPPHFPTVPLQKSEMTRWPLSRTLTPQCSPDGIIVQLREPTTPHLLIVSRQLPSHTQ
jgi:hypothetical protein